MDCAILKKFQKTLGKAKSPSDRFNAYEDLAEFYYRNQDYKSCLPFFQKELEAAEDLQDDSKVAKAHRMIGEVLSLLGEYESSLKHHQEFYKLVQAGGSDRLHEQQRALTTLGRTYLLYADSQHDRDSPKVKKLYNKAHKCLIRSLEVCEVLKKKGIVAKSEIDSMNAVSLLNLGVFYESQKDFPKAIDNYSLALRVCRASKLSSLQRQCCVNLANIFVRCNKLPDAFELFKEAIESAKTLPDEERRLAERDILIAEEEAHFQNGDVHSARKVLQKAYFMKPSLDQDPDLIEKYLKLDVAMDYALRSLKSNSYSPEDEYKLHERLGDGFSSRRAFEHALEHYKKMLQCCKSAGLDLKPCYLSLAQTSKDLHRYEEAINYFEEEIAVSNPKDGCQSLLLVELCQELSNVSVEDRLHTVKRAWEMAQKISETKLKVQVLSKLVELQQKCGDSQVEDSKAMLETLKGHVEDSSSESEESEDGTQDIGEHIDLTALSDCSQGDDEQEFEVLEDTFGPSSSKRPRRNANRYKSNVMWRNEKGETKLHLACIHRKVKSVKTLLEQGSDVNAIDHAGWTPLHEACNHGFVEIVEMLLDHGAAINYKGSDGITPLHDAASAGNFEVIDFLLKRNASVDVFTTKGESPLDVLTEYRNRAGDSLTPEEEEEYLKTRNKLKDALDKVGHIPKNKSTNISNCFNAKGRDSFPTGHKNISSNPRAYSGNLRKGIDIHDIQDTQPDRSLTRDLSPASSFSPSSISSGSLACSPMKLSSDEDERLQSVSEYQQAMKRIRKKNIVDEIPHEAKKIIPPLIPANEIVEDWLDDDLKGRPSKRRRTIDHPKLPSNNYKPLSLKKQSSARNSRASSGASSCGSRNSMGSLGSHEDGWFPAGSRTIASPELESSKFLDDNKDCSIASEALSCYSPYRTADDNTLISSLSSPTFVSSYPRQGTLSAYNITKKALSSPPIAQPGTQLSIQAPPNRINVEIEDRLFTIPIVDQALTVKWLKEEAANRFYTIKGIRPKLEIQTAEGACVADDDPVSFFVDGGKLLGIVKNVAAITDRYKDACTFDNVDINNEVLGALEQIQATQTLMVTNCAFSLPVLKPLFKAISMELSLMTINLSNNSIGDEGLLDLCNHIGRLLNLKCLDLSCNGLSVHGVEALAHAAQTENLKGLVELNLSFNDLEDTCVPVLSQLTAAIPGLQRLSLADCYFSKHMWDGHNHLLSLSNLKFLDVSGNMLEAKGVAGLLGFLDHDQSRRLNPNVLEVLQLVGVGGSHICQELVLFFESAEVIALTDLRISYSDMQDDDFICLLRILQSASKLRSLSVPAAAELSGALVCKLLSRQPPLNKVEIKINSAKWKNVAQEDLIAAARTAAKGIENLTLKEAPVIFEETWKETVGLTGSVKRGAFGTQVFTAVKNLGAAL